MKTLRKMVICLLFPFFLCSLSNQIYASSLPNIYETGEASGDDGVSAEASGGDDAALELKSILTNNEFGLLTILKDAGAVLAGIGACQWILSFKDDRPDEKVNATGKILVGIVLILLQSIMGTIMNGTFGSFNL